MATRIVSADQQEIVRDLQRTVARLTQKLATAEERAALAEKSARDAWAFGRLMLRRPS